MIRRHNKRDRHRLGRRLNRLFLPIISQGIKWALVDGDLYLYSFLGLVTTLKTVRSDIQPSFNKSTSLGTFNSKHQRVVKNIIYCQCIYITITILFISKMTPFVLLNLCVVETFCILMRTFIGCTTRYVQGVKENATGNKVRSIISRHQRV